MATSPDATGASFGPNPSTQKVAQWNGQLNDPNGLTDCVYAIAAREGNGDNTSLAPNWTVVGAGSYGAWQWQWVDGLWQQGCQQYTVNGLHPYVNLANTYPSQCPPAAQLAIATMQIGQLFQQYHNWYSVAQAWNGGAGGVGQSYTDYYASHVVANMQAIAKTGGNETQTPPVDPVAPTGATSGGGTLVNTPEPVNNSTIVRPGLPFSLNNVRINNTPLGLTRLGDRTLLDLVSDCSVDMTVNQLSSVEFTFQQGDAVVDALGLGIGVIAATPQALNATNSNAGGGFSQSLVEVDFCDSNGNIKWPLVISTVQMTSNAAQQPAVQITCTSKCLQLWQGIYPPSGSAPTTSPTNWLMQQCYNTMGRKQYDDGRWVFAGKQTYAGGDPNFIVQPPDAATGTIQSAIYDVAQAVQQSQGFYLFDSFGTTWFGDPTWITTKTQTVNITYVPAGRTPYDGTVGPDYTISPVGPPQLSMTIQAVPNGFGLVQNRQIVRTVTVQLPQYMAAQIGTGFHVVLSGTGPWYDSYSSSPNIGPRAPYIVTEVTGTVDGGLSTWTVTFQEAVLPSQPTTPANTVTAPIFSLTPASSPGTLVDPYTKQPLPASGGNGMLASQFLGYLESVVGDPYVSGGIGPTSFDCSGLVCWGLGLVGLYNHPRTSQDFYIWCTHISVQAAFNTPGALLFGSFMAVSPINGEAGPDHMCVSLGNGSIIEAPYTGANVSIVPAMYNSSTGCVVTTGPPDSGYSFSGAGLVPGLKYNMGINGQGATPLPTAATSPDAKPKATGPAAAPTVKTTFTKRNTGTGPEAI